MGWVVLLRLLQLGALLQVPTITIGQAVLLREDIITHLAVLRLLQLGALLQEVIPTTHPVIPRPVDLTLIQPAVIRQADTITLQLLQQSMAESQSLSG